MSRFTTELRWPIEQYQDEHNLNRRTYTVAIYKLIGLDEYPIFEESYRKHLNDKIIEHYYFKEIGTETLARFRWYMRVRMNEIMPKFNVLYEAQNSIVDPMTNRNLSWDELWHIDEDGGTNTDRDTSTAYGKTETKSEEYTENRDIVDTGTKLEGGTSNTSSISDENRTNGGRDSTMAGATKEKVISSDTPMNELQTNAVENGNYATNVTYTTREGERVGYTEYGGTTDIDSNTNSTLTRNLTTTENGRRDDDVKREGGYSIGHGGRDTVSDSTDYARNLDTDGTKRHNDIGYEGVSPTALLAELSEKFTNIDLMVIESINDLFMGLWE